MTISRVGELFPKYKTHFNFPTEDACVKSMGKAEKHGKILYKFFHAAVSGNQWKTESCVKKMLQCCITHKKLVSGEYKKKFKNMKLVFEKEIGDERKKAPISTVHQKQKHKKDSHHKCEEKTTTPQKTAPAHEVKAPEPIQPPQAQANIPDPSARFLRRLREDIFPQIREPFAGLGESSALPLALQRATFQYLESSGTPIAQQLLNELYEVGYDRFAIAHNLPK